MTSRTCALAFLLRTSCPSLLLRLSYSADRIRGYRKHFRVKQCFTVGRRLEVEQKSVLASRTEMMTVGFLNENRLLGLARD